MENLRAEVVKYMRSCLNSNKDAVCSSIKVGQLNDDYECLIGEVIPFKKLGFDTLIELIKSEPKEFSLVKKDNAWFVRANESNKTAHITSMVGKQKRSRKRRPKAHSLQTAAPKWRPPQSAVPISYRGSNRAQTVDHTQFVNRGPSSTSKSNNQNKPRHTPTTTPNYSKNQTQPQQTTNTTANRSKNQTQPRQTTTTTPNRSNNRSQPQQTTNTTANRSKNQTQPRQTTTTTPNRSNNQSQPQQTTTTTPKRSRNRSRRHQTSLAAQSMNQRLNKIKQPENIKELNNNNTSSPGTSGIGNDGHGGSCGNSQSKIPEFVRTNDALQDLKRFVEINELGDIKVSVAEYKEKKKKIFFVTIKIGSKYSYSSYPKDFFNPLEAQDFCCEEAFKDLIPKCKRKYFLVASEKDILDRIPPMLEKHPHGIWASQLEDIYSDKYNEVLSKDWLKIVDMNQSVRIEKLQNDYILYHWRHSENVLRRNTSVPVSKLSVPANTIQLDKDGRMVAQVLCVVSAAEIWCQQIDTLDNEHFMEMLYGWQSYYEEHKNQLVPEKIVPGGYYMGKRRGSYFRVRVLGVNGDEIDGFFIDLGAEWTFSRSEIFELKREYANVQAQAFVCRLYGLEELYEVPIDAESVKDLLDNFMLLEVALEVGNNDIHDALPVYMNDYETGRSINEELIPKLTREMAQPKLSQRGVTQVYVCNIEPNGDIYVQVRSQGYKNFLRLKQMIEEQIRIMPPNQTLQKVTKLNSMNKLYFFKQSKDEWSRIKFIDWSPDGKYAQIYFVDDGYTRIITVADEKLYPLGALNDIFNNYPPQAARVRIDLEEIPIDFVELAAKLMPKDNPVMLRIVKTTDTYVVKLFRRIDDGSFFCINSSLALNSQLKKEENDNLQCRLQHLNLTGSVPSAPVLKPPSIPKIGDRLQVYISFAINPYNFYFVPKMSRLNKIMDRMQERYKDVQKGNLKVEDILLGGTYASKNEGDGSWYRTTVKKVTDSGSVSVWYCDFGSHSTINVQQLVSLDEEFTDLPYQAFKAKLTGIKPTQGEWTMDNCERFSRLIIYKWLDAILEEIVKDDLNEGDLVFKVKLIDLNKTYVHDELVKRGIAKRADN